MAAELRGSGEDTDAGPTFRVDGWKDDENLKDDLDRYVTQLLKRDEILSFMQRDFPAYAWSLHSLDRRLRHFGLY